MANNHTQVQFKEITMFTQEMIDRMDKAQVTAALKLSGLLDTETVAKLNARKDALAAPPAPTPFPKQAELTDAWQQWQAWGETVKGLVTEARKGFHSYILNPKEGTVTPKRRQRKDGTGGTTRGKAGDLQITVNGADFDSWTAVCDALVPNLVADKAAAGTEKKNIGWRNEAYKAAKAQGAAVKLTFKTEEKYDVYAANKWLPEGFTVVKSF